MTLATFLFAILALLLSPGPTNTLIFLAGAQRGIRRAWQLIPWELLGYLTAIAPLAYAGAQLFGHWPAAAIGLRIAAGIWVLLLAISLWKIADHAADPVMITPRRVYVTTLLNPKALIVGLVLLPAPGSPDFAIKFAMFFLVAALVAVGWSVAGLLTKVGTAGTQRLRIVQRMASLWLAVVSVTLFAAAFRV